MGPCMGIRFIRAFTFAVLPACLTMPVTRTIGRSGGGTRNVVACLHQMRLTMFTQSGSTFCCVSNSRTNPSSLRNGPKQSVWPYPSGFLALFFCLANALLLMNSSPPKCTCSEIYPACDMYSCRLFSLSTASGRTTTVLESSTPPLWMRWQREVPTCSFFSSPLPFSVSSQEYVVWRSLGVDYKSMPAPALAILLCSKLPKPGTAELGRKQCTGNPRSTRADVDRC